MSRLLNVGVIGLGRLGSVYARNLAQRVPDARLVAVADQKAELREQFARELGGVKVYENHLDLLNDKDVEAVAIITSTSC
jgi:predicted dehydrogenase